MRGSDSFAKKELIIIINNNDIPVRPYRAMVKKYRNIRVYRKKEITTLGKCLNFGIRESKYSHIAKFDDDDYYAPRYLSDAMNLFRSKKVDVVGKRAHFLWLDGKKVLILRNPNRQYQRVRILPGATLVFKKSVFRKVRFSNVDVGEDDKFCQKCRAKGYTVYSRGKYNFAALRRKHSRDHTWIISEKKLLSGNVKVIRNVKNYKKFVTRNK
ncbi:glycosyltransferase family A protein [Paenibacillus filicis]|uniref:Glycosyltransferase family A protein n=1 Tax=Paenibacillus gyeongsangnamensis TaxID=3388067 RepID=A0ABT4QK15_9BACL|nr:glycosyltransferase family A protein [Paenibacillus filicis]MCZ8517200.1 glycosyltransferase family A protein [Paenibacillus filicis]